MKNLTWQNPEQLFVAQVLINQVKSKCCGIKDYKTIERIMKMMAFGIMIVAVAVFALVAGEGMNLGIKNCK